MAGTTQPSERLRAIHLVYDMPINIKQARAVWPLVHEVLIPDHVVERTLHHDACHLASICTSAQHSKTDNCQHDSQSANAAMTSSRQYLAFRSFLPGCRP